jgi:uncharacterized protein YecE (DUF72 family)
MCAESFKIKIGCCGFPHGMKNYFKEFPLVEVQKTFYKPMKSDTAIKWRANAPVEFEFTVKAWQLITHPPSSPTYRKAKIELEGEKENYGFFKPTQEVLKAWEATTEVCLALQTKFIVFQTPASFKPIQENIRNLRKFFATISNGNFRFVFEPRGDWEDSLLKEICSELNLIHGVDPFARMPVTDKVAYFRLHGSPPGKKMYAYKYTTEDLQKLLRICERYEVVYCLFNNIYMYEDAINLQSMVKGYKSV